MLNNNETVSARPSTLLIVNVDWSVTSSDDRYHVMLAGGLQYDVEHVKFICCPAITELTVGNIVTDETGTALMHTKTCLLR